MVIKDRILKGEYRESISLMRMSQDIQELDGVERAEILMATDENREFLKDADLLTDNIQNATQADLAIIVDAESDERADELLDKAEQKVEDSKKGKTGEEEEKTFRTLKSAMESNPDSNLVLISTPGEWADREAEKALENDKHVMLFSDGVPVEEEIRLKEMGEEKDLLVMGPDCGTAIINGVGLGFANSVERGPIGIVAASGTGAQSVSSLVSTFGPGISQVIGTGGRDLHEEVEGKTMRMGIEALADDPETETIVLVSKPPAPEVAKKVLDTAKKVDKPIVVNFLGGDPSVIKEAGLEYAETLEDAAMKAIALQKGEEATPTTFEASLEEIKELAEKEYSQLDDQQKYIRGLYSGGTFTSEALLTINDLVGQAYSNVAIDPEYDLEDPMESKEHSIVDMGEDAFTAELGKPHPMIYHGLRQDRIMEEASDPETAVLLLDVVLGHGADEDPAGALAPTIEEAKELAKEEGRKLPVVASVCGTSQDPQVLEEQEEKLEEVGVIVMPSNAQAARMASIIATKGKAIEKLEE